MRKIFIKTLLCILCVSALLFTFSACKKDSGYKLNFYVEGELYKSVAVMNDGSFEAPSVPVKDGYEFTGWSANFSNVQGDLVITPKYEKLDMRSQALKNFDSAVSVAEGAAKSSLLVRLAKIQSAYDKWLLVDANEEGAAEAYARLEAIVNAYNRDIALYNGAMADAESVSQTVIKCSVPERND